MFNLQYDENPNSMFRFRHPGVVLFDLVGLTLSLAALLISPNIQTTLYLCSVVSLYFVSVLHHWFAHANFRRSLDHATIYLVIGATVLPYWSFHLANSKQLLLLILGLSTGLGMLSKFVTIGSRKLSTVLFSAVGMLSVLVMLGISKDIGMKFGLLFWAGVALYVMQMIIYRNKMFDLYPKYFGYREVQHLVLLCATSTHTILAVITAS